MGHRLSKIYTKTGDDGTTGLGDGSRVAKDATRVEAYGTVDELNSTFGLLLSHPLPDNIRTYLIEIQHQLFDLGGELCLPGYIGITEGLVTKIEQNLDILNDFLPPLKEFVLPNGSSRVAHCHLARTVCRRAERRLITLTKEEPVSPLCVQYVNRLSDYLFVLARYLAHEEKAEEILWEHERKNKA